jgi:hypothetical protein
MGHSTILLLRVFAAAGTCIPRRCLAMNGEIHFTGPLLSNDGGGGDIHTETNDGRDQYSTQLRRPQVP